MGESKIDVFHLLRENLLAQQRLYEDPHFPAVSSSVSFSSPEQWDVIWRRPNELSSVPVFIEEDESKGLSILPGQFANHWFASALYSLRRNKILFQHVVPNDQNFKYKYAGLFLFRFWRYGKWIDVVVDDLLPVNYEGLALFTRSKGWTEFWVPLLEKALAKVHGAYEGFSFPNRVDDIIDLTGGLKEVHTHVDTSINLFPIIEESYRKGSLIMSSSAPRRESGVETKNVCCVIDVQELIHQDESVKVLKLVNPQGQSLAWRGSWSVTSPWNSISHNLREKLQHTSLREGECWMKFDDFIEAFDVTVTCHLQSVFLGGGPQTSAGWFVSRTEGKWCKEISAGGNPYLKTTYMNLQFPVELKYADDDDHYHCTIIIGLMQEYLYMENKKTKNILEMGFAVYSVPKQEFTTMGTKFFKENQPIVISQYLPVTEIAKRYKFPRGNYLIVPSTDSAGLETKFLLRLFTLKPHNISGPLQNTVQQNIKDLKYSLAVPNNVDLGFPVRVLLKLENTGRSKIHVLVILRLYGKLNNEEYPIKAKKEVILIPKLAEAKLSLTVNYLDYGFIALEGGILCAIFQIIEKKKSYISESRNITLRQPSLNIDRDLSTCKITSKANRFILRPGKLIHFGYSDCLYKEPYDRKLTLQKIIEKHFQAESKIVIGTNTAVKANFKNPLPLSVENGVVVIEGDGIEESKKFKTGRIGPYSKVNVKFTLLPIQVGKHTLKVTLSGNPLGSVEGIKEVEFLNPRLKSSKSKRNK